MVQYHEETSTGGNQEKTSELKKQKKQLGKNGERTKASKKTKKRFELKKKSGSPTDFEMQEGLLYDSRQHALPITKKESYA